jgi:hypothetical protein
VGPTEVLASVLTAHATPSRAASRQVVAVAHHLIRPHPPGQHQDNVDLI